MYKSKLKLSFVLTVALLVCNTTYALQVKAITEYKSTASQSFINTNDDKVVAKIYFKSGFTKTDEGTITFEYRILNKDGINITKYISADQIIATSEGTAIILNPLYGTGIITFKSPSDINKSRKVLIADSITRIWDVGEIIGTDDKEKNDEATKLIEKELDSKLSQIVFASDKLTETSENTALFNYQALNWLGKDITKSIPVDQIIPAATVGSKITLDSQTGTGILTYDNSDIDKPDVITLADKITGYTAVLNIADFQPEQIIDNNTSIASRIIFTSADIIQTGENTAIFNYKILDNYYKDITSTISSKDLTATAMIDSTKVNVSLDPSTGTGKISYNFTETDKSVMVTLIYSNGIEVTAMLNMYDPQIYKSIDKDDLSVAQITFLLTDTICSGKITDLRYRILNKYGKDITSKVPAPQIELIASENSMLYLEPSTGTCKIIYDTYNTNKMIIVKLKDKLTGVTAALNIGNKKSWKSDVDKSINQIAIDSNNLTRISENKAAFNYRMIAQNGEDITEAIPVSQVETKISLEADIMLNPLSRIGTITYKSYQDSTQPIVVTLTDKISGVKVSMTLKVINSSNSTLSNSQTPDLPIYNENEESRINKINITSTKLAIDNTGVGYATYNIRDQYGQDVTNSPLANSVVFKSNIATIKANSGLLIITANSGINLNECTSIIITASDPATGISISSTLAIEIK